MTLHGNLTLTSERSLPHLQKLQKMIWIIVSFTLNSIVKYHRGGDGLSCSPGKSKLSISQKFCLQYICHCQHFLPKGLNKIHIDICVYMDMLIAGKEKQEACTFTAEHIYIYIYVYIISPAFNYHLLWSGINAKRCYLMFINDDTGFWD